MNIFIRSSRDYKNGKRPPRGSDPSLKTTGLSNVILY